MSLANSNFSYSYHLLCRFKILNFIMYSSCFQMSTWCFMTQKGKLYLTEFWLSDGYSLEISRSTLAMKVLIGVQRKRYSHSLTEIQIGTLQSVSCRRDVVIWESACSVPYRKGSAWPEQRVRGEESCFL